MANRIALASLLVTAATLVQRAEAQPDPLQLIRTVADGVARAPHASATLTVRGIVHRGDQSDEHVAAYRFEQAVTARGRARRLSTPADSKARFDVRAVGDVLLTHDQTNNRYSIHQHGEAFAQFVESPMAAAVASGLGGVPLAFVDGPSADKLIEAITDSEFLGVGWQGDQPTLRCRYRLPGDIGFEVVYLLGGEPLPASIDFDLSERLPENPTGNQPTGYRLSVAFDRWDRATPAPSESFALVAPADAEFLPLLSETIPQPPNPLIGKRIPDATFTDARGRSVSLAAFRGRRTVLLEVWAACCDGARKSFRRTRELGRELAPRGVAHLSVNANEDAEAVNEFLRAEQIATPPLMAARSVVEGPLRVTGTPTFFVIDRAGRVQSVRVGYPDSVTEQLRDDLERTLAGATIADEVLDELLEAHEKQRAERTRLHELLDAALSPAVLLGQR